MIIADYHTHTRYSHGTGKIEQNVAEAERKGLQQVGISDHGLRHIAFGLRTNDIFKMRSCIEKIRGTYNVDILYGVEANICGSTGVIDLNDVCRNYFDYVIAGYHILAWPKPFAEMFKFTIPSICNINTTSIAQINKNTQTYIKAIKTQRINIISHLNHAMPVNVEEVGKAALDYGVYIELNGKKVSMSDDQILRLEQMGVNFIVNSDAHSADRVGEFSVPMTVVERLNLNKSQIANWDKLPNFAKQL